MSPSDPVQFTHASRPYNSGMKLSGVQYRRMPTTDGGLVCGDTAGNSGGQLGPHHSPLRKPWEGR
jgi:hypothetical protein